MSEEKQEPQHVDEDELDESEAELLPDRKAMSFLDLPGPIGSTFTLPIEPPSTE
jgi:hypothetical protein